MCDFDMTKAKCYLLIRMSEFDMPTGLFHPLANTEISKIVGQFVSHASAAPALARCLIDANADSFA